MIIVSDCRTMAQRMPLYLDEELAATERRALEAHLRVCTDCRQNLSRLKTVQDMGMALIQPEIPKTEFQDVPQDPIEPIEETSEEESPAFLEGLKERIGAAPWWMASGLFHGLILLLLMLLGMILQIEFKDPKIITTSLVEEKDPEPEEELLHRTIKSDPKSFVTEEMELVETVVVTNEEVEIAEYEETENDSDAAEAVGEDAISDIPLGGSGSFGAIGLGGGGGGAFGRPTGKGGRLRRARRSGGSVKTESAVEGALAWLARHQEENGKWCGQRNGAKSAGYDVGLTGLSTLAFLGAGHSPKIGTYKDNVKRAVKWMLKNQGANGDFNANQPVDSFAPMYNHCIATLACAEAMAMSGKKITSYSPDEEPNDPLAKGVFKGVKLILQWQERNPTGGWSYYNEPCVDQTVTGWAIMALKSAKVAGYPVPLDSFTKAQDALTKLLKRNPDDDGYETAMTGYCGNGPRSLEFDTRGNVCTAATLTCLRFMDSDPVKSGADACASYITQPDSLPEWNFAPANRGQTIYYWYYGTLGSFQSGGDAWATWNGSLKKALLPNQRKGGPKDGSAADIDGSWDHNDLWGKWAGRVYSTALSALCLEVYYRYLPMFR